MKKLILIVAVLAFAGCAQQVETADDGTQQTYYVVDPNVSAFGKGLEGPLTLVVNTAPALAPTWPPAAAVGSIAAAILAIGGALAKLKIRKVENEGNDFARTLKQSYAAGQGIVSAIEQFKRESPELWEKLAAELRNRLGPEERAMVEKLKAPGSVVDG